MYSKLFQITLHKIFVQSFLQLRNDPALLMVLFRLPRIDVLRCMNFDSMFGVDKYQIADTVDNCKY